MLDQAVQHGHALDREAADGGFGGERQARGAVEHRVHDVLHLGPRGLALLDHRLQEVRRDEDPLAACGRLADDDLLDEGDPLQRDLLAQVAAVDEQHVRALDDLRQVFQGIDTLDLGDDLHPSRRHGPHLVHRRSRPHEGDGDVLDTLAQADPNRFQVLLRKDWQPQGPRRDRIDDHGLVAPHPSTGDRPRRHEARARCRNVGDAQHQRVEVHVEQVPLLELGQDGRRLELQAAAMARLRPGPQTQLVVVVETHDLLG